MLLVRNNYPWQQQAIDFSIWRQASGGKGYAKYSSIKELFGNVRKDKLCSYILEVKCKHYFSSLLKFETAYIFIPDSESWYTKVSVINPASRVVSGISCDPALLILVCSGRSDFISISSICANLSHTISKPRGYFLNDMWAYPYFFIFLPCFSLSYTMMI